MVKKSLIIDAGHGGKDPGAIGFGVEEKKWALAMSLYQFERLDALGANVALTRSDDRTLDSASRTKLIKDKYDYCMSNHFNAFNGTARGVETIYSIYANDRIAGELAGAISQQARLPLRRVFKREGANGDYYYMHRLTGKTETIIVEYGFIDNKGDHEFYKNDANFYKVAEAVIKVWCKHLGVEYKPVSAPGGKLYKVQTGAFSSEANAKALASKLEKDGYKTYIVIE